MLSISRVATLILSALPVFAAELKIDHVTVAGSHLDAMRQAFTDATRLPTEYGGRHANYATEMALSSFPDGSYLELMAIQPQADPAAVAAHVWGKFLKENAGPCAFALRIPDTNAQVAELKSAGIQVKAPDHSGRTRPDGTRLEWETTDVGPGPRGGLFPFLIHDLTPRQNRVYPSGKPTTNRINGVSKVVIGVRDLDAAIAQYRRAFNLPAPHRQRDPVLDAQLAWFEGTPVVLAQGLSDTGWLTRRVREYGDAPCAFVFSASTIAATGAPPSQWFGHSIVWTDERRLTWRLGIEVL
jgi:catechol 2,3-dioxygenase-like lactoylglutathione lyase family enzyme